jgi:hypothetical protein
MQARLNHLFGKAIVLVLKRSGCIDHDASARAAKLGGRRRFRVDHGGCGSAGAIPVADFFSRRLRSRQIAASDHNIQVGGREQSTHQPMAESSSAAYDEDLLGYHLERAF